MEDNKYIEGFKVFDSDFKTMNGIKFAVGMHKHIDGKIISGPSGGHGFHVCKNFEDTFRFAKNNPILCEVIGFGTIGTEYLDDYNGYYGIYACSDIFIKRIISREEIIEMAKKLPKEKLSRLIITYNMTLEEVKEIENSLPPYSEHIKKLIDYYQRGNKNAFK